MILKKLVVICLTRTGHCPKVNKKNNNKNIIKPVYHAFAYGIQTARNKLGKHINCPCTQSKIKVFAVSPRRSLGANTPVKRPGYVLIVSFMGCAGENQRKGIFSFAGIPLGYAWRNNNKKKTKERKRTNEAFEANIKHNIYIYIFYLVVRFRMVSVRGQRKLGPRPGTGLL